MLSITINSILQKDAPTQDDFADLVKEIEESNIFSGKPRRFVGERKIVGYYILDRSKSLFRGDTFYEISEFTKSLDQEELEKPENLQKKHALGYCIFVTNSKVRIVFRSDKTIFPGGTGVEFMPHRYL